MDLEVVTRPHQLNSGSLSSVVEMDQTIRRSNSWYTGDWKGYDEFGECWNSGGFPVHMIEMMVYGIKLSIRAAFKM